MKLGVFLPIGNNGWIISTTSPQYMPSFDLNRTVTEKAERFGFDFAMSMIKLHGFGGPSEYWDHNLDSFTLMAGLAATTSRIQLIATCAVLVVPPAITARMAMTIDSISNGRFGVNIVSGWQRREYTQMGLWPGAEHYKRRYEYCAEYVTILRELWATGRSDLKGQFFQMDDCRCSPLPKAQIPIVCAGQSDAGTRFAAEHVDYNFCVSFGENTPTAVAPSVARLVKATRETGRKCGALILIMIIAEETDAEAKAKWEHYKAGADLEALDYRAAQAEEIIAEMTAAFVCAELGLASEPRADHAQYISHYLTLLCDDSRAIFTAAAAASKAAAYLFSFSKSVDTPCPATQPTLTEPSTSCFGPTTATTSSRLISGFYKRPSTDTSTIAAAKPSSSSAAGSMPDTASAGCTGSSISSWRQTDMSAGAGRSSSTTTRDCAHPRTGAAKRSRSRAAAASSKIVASP